METLERQVLQARRRLMLQSLTGKLAWCWFATFLLAAIAVGVGKFFRLADERIWLWGALSSALGIGLLAAFVWVWLTRQNTLDAAVEIDRRFGLKERVSSSLALGPRELETPAGQALVADARERLQRIDVRDQFGLRLDRRALLPLAPAALALALAVLVPGREPLAPAAATAGENVQVKKSAQALAKKLEQERKEAKEQGLSEADALLKQLEEGAKTLADKSKLDRKQTLVALNSLVKDAEKRREQLAAGAEMKQQLNQLKNLQQGPAEKLGQALKVGDLKKAVEELEKLKADLAGNKLDEKAKEQLAKQLEQMEKTLAKAAEAHEHAKEDLRQQIESQRRAGNTEQASKLQEQLDKLAQKSPHMDKLAQMSQQLKQASECMKAGDCDQAAKTLDQMGQALSEMAKESEELETLDDALSQIADAKEAMACKECEGQGCKACQGKGDRVREQRFAKGSGRGAGDREEMKHDTDFYDSNVKQNVGKGASVVTGQTGGPNRKGEVQQEIRGQFSAGEQQSEDVLSGQRLPHDYRDHAKKYFDSLREGSR